MKKWYREFFYVPKHGKVREKVMLTRVVMTVAVIVMCLAAMGATAYAYFSYNITSGAGVIKAAHFGTKITVQILDENNQTVDFTPVTRDYQIHTVRGLEAGKIYTVTITPAENSTAKTGFVVVSAQGCQETYHTQQLGIDVNASGGKTDAISFKLMLTEPTEVTFLAHWGTSSCYPDYQNREELYIIQNEQVKLIINGQTEPVIQPEDTEPTQTQPEETQPTETQPTETQPVTEPEQTEPDTQPPETEETTLPEETTAPAE